MEDGRKIEVILQTALSLVSEYSEGNLALFSGLMNQFSSLHQLYKRNTDERIIAFLLEGISAELFRCKFIPYARNILHDGLGLLIRINAAGQERNNIIPDDALRKEADNFISRNNPTGARDSVSIHTE